MEAEVFVTPPSLHAGQGEMLVMAAMVGFICFVALIVLVVKIWICCRIFAKAGYSWALGLLMLVPVVNVILPFYLALAEWPVQQELRRLKEQQSQPAD